MTYVCSMIAIAQQLPQIPQTNVSLLCHEAFVQYTDCSTDLHIK